MHISIKGLIVGGMILGLMIPTLFILGLVNDRSERKEEVFKDVTSKWAGGQTIAGPILIVPYLEHDLVDGKPTTVRRQAYFLPDHLTVSTDMETQVRYRSIYKVPVYEGNVRIEGDFSPLPLQALEIDSNDLLPAEAVLCMGLGDLRGVEEPLQFQWDGADLTMNAGVPTNDVVDVGMNASPALRVTDVGTSHTFSIRMRLRGSNTLYFTPLGKSTEVSLRSGWKAPSFDGNFLPLSKTVTSSGFTANWKVLYLNRNFPQYWVEKKYDIQSASFGVSLFQATDVYSQTTRCVKYAILFIGLTFSLYFFMEIFQEKRVHLMQYVLVGIALSIFYTLLLSISEYLGFSPAYGIAGSVTILLISIYTGSVFGKASVGWMFGAVLVALYGFIFFLVQLQDSALLFGSIGLFLILALVMYYSRRVDWNKGSVVQTKPI